MAAYREGMKTVLIPKDNEPDLYEVDDEVKKNLTFLPMQSLTQVLNAALLKPQNAKKAKAPEPHPCKEKGGRRRHCAAHRRKAPARRGVLRTIETLSVTACAVQAPPKGGA